MMGGGGTTVNYPQPSAEERALQQQQTELLRQQTGLLQTNLKQQQLLAPTLYKQLGIQPQYNQSGDITGYTELPKTAEQTLQDQLTNQYLTAATQQMQTNAELAPQAAEIQKKLNERTLSALSGTLPVDPALENQLQTGEQQLRDTLFKQLGPGYETSTPGIQALAEFQKRANELRSGARTAQLTLSEQLAGARSAAGAQPTSDYFNNQQFQSALRQQRFGNIANMPNLTTTTGMPGYQSLIQGYQNPINWYGQQRQGQFNAQVANAQSQSAANSGWGQLFGSGLGAFASIFPYL